MGPAHGKMSGRIGVSEENVGYAVSGLASRIPGFQNRGHVLSGPSDFERTSVDQHKHNRLADSHDCFEQFLLSAGKFKRRSRSSLTAHERDLAEHDNRNIAALGEIDRVIEGFACFFRSLLWLFFHRDERDVLEE